MKKTKKLLALALALMLSLSCMAMPAMAMENGSARGVNYCSICKKFQDYTRIPTSGILHEVRTVGGCSKTNNTHQHTVYYQTYIWQCPGCEDEIIPHELEDHHVCHYKG